MSSMKENNIQKYIMDVDFDGEWSVDMIKNAIQKITGESPGIKINYEKDVVLNEIKGEATEIKKLNSIELFFTDLDDKIKRVEYLLN